MKPIPRRTHTHAHTHTDTHTHVIITGLEDMAMGTHIELKDGHAKNVISAILSCALWVCVRECACIHPQL